jgi:hypothetical protein
MFNLAMYSKHYEHETNISTAYIYELKYKRIRKQVKKLRLMLAFRYLAKQKLTKIHL